MQIVDTNISLEMLNQMSQKMFGRLVKAVVDIEKEIMVVDAALHADEEDLLLENESIQENLWGINLHPAKWPHEHWIEFDSMINLRPADGNNSRSVESELIRKKNHCSCQKVGDSMIRKKNFVHKDLSTDRWFAFSLLEQLANVGTDVDRAIRYQNQGDLEASKAAAIRALELLYLTIEDKKNKKHLREPIRVRATLADYFFGINEFNFTAEYWQSYFYDFNYAAALQRRTRKTVA